MAPRPQNQAPRIEVREIRVTQPIAFKVRLVQYVGRILRAYLGKSTAEIHDSHDVAAGALASSLAKRAPGYTSLGFPNLRRMA